MPKKVIKHHFCNSIRHTQSFCLNGLLFLSAGMNPNWSRFLLARWSCSPQSQCQSTKRKSTDTNTRNSHIRLHHSSSPTRETGCHIYLFYTDIKSKNKAIGTATLSRAAASWPNPLMPLPTKHGLLRNPSTLGCYAILLPLENIRLAIGPILGKQDGIHKARITHCI